jgi:hypothetical protein
MADPDTQETAMSMNHDLTTRLARDHQRQMLVEASQQRHQQRHQPRHPVSRTRRTATRIIRGLAAAITAHAW